MLRGLVDRGDDERALLAELRAADAILRRIELRLDQRGHHDGESYFELAERRLARARAIQPASPLLARLTRRLQTLERRRLAEQLRGAGWEAAREQRVRRRAAEGDAAAVVAARAWRILDSGGSPRWAHGLFLEALALAAPGSAAEERAEQGLEAVAARMAGRFARAG